MCCRASSALRERLVRCFHTKSVRSVEVLRVGTTRASVAAADLDAREGGGSGRGTDCYMATPRLNEFMYMNYIMMNYM